jgi:hypothetical protein
MSRHGYRGGMSVLKLESKNMSHATPIKSAPVIEYAEYAPEEADRPPTAQAIAVETKNLSRAVVDKVLVRDISVQVQ